MSSAAWTKCPAATSSGRNGLVRPLSGSSGGAASVVLHPPAGRSTTLGEQVAVEHYARREGRWCNGNMWDF